MSDQRPGRPATIADVAARAGVSPATVSRVMNGTRAVDQEMTERVRAAAAELDYSPSPLARSLVLGRTNTVAVVVPDLGNPTFHGVLRGLSHAAARNGYHVLVADSAESVTAEVTLAQQTRRRCDGVVLVAPRMRETDLAHLLRTLQPVVVVNREPAGEHPSPVVTADYRLGLTDLLELLYAEGHRSLTYLAGAPQSASNARRLAALADFRAAHPDLRVQIRPCGVNFADGYDAAEDLVSAGVTGVLAFNDLVAMGLISALGAAGVAVPAAMSVVGFDDIPFAPYVTPPLTTAAVPVTELGEQAWQGMWDLLSGGPTRRTVVLDPQVVRRGSTGPAARAPEAPAPAVPAPAVPAPAGTTDGP